MVVTDALPRIALSVRQPWAWAIIHGGKRLENRTAMAIRSGRMITGVRIAIHASSGMTRDEYESARDGAFRWAKLDPQTIPRPDALVRGAIIGSVFVDHVISKSTSPWFVGPRALVLADPEACDPIGCKGQLGYFNWRPEGEPCAPLRWMQAWPNRYHPHAKTPDGIIVQDDQPALFGKGDAT